MNPRDRKLRLRKTTVRGLNEESASNVRGGTIILSMFICPKPNPEPIDTAGASCEYLCTNLWTDCPVCPTGTLAACCV